MYKNVDVMLLPKALLADQGSRGNEGQGRRAARSRIGRGQLSLYYVFTEPLDHHTDNALVIFGGGVSVVCLQGNNLL